MTLASQYLKKIRRSVILLAVTLIGVLAFMYYLSGILTELEEDAGLQGEKFPNEDGLLGRERGGGVTVLSPIYDASPTPSDSP